MDNERALIIIKRHIDYDLLNPYECWHECIFDMQAYSRWAANEIYERIANEANRLPSHITGQEQRAPISIINEFIDLMDECYDAYKDFDDIQKVFMYAKFEALDILDLLYS